MADASSSLPALIAVVSGAIAVAFSKIFDSRKTTAETTLTVQTIYSGILTDVRHELEESEERCERKLQEAKAPLVRRIEELEAEVACLRKAGHEGSPG